MSRISFFPRLSAAKAVFDAVLPSFYCRICYRASLINGCKASSLSSSLLSLTTVAVFIAVVVVIVFVVVRVVVVCCCRHRCCCCHCLCCCPCSLSLSLSSWLFLLLLSAKTFKNNFLLFQHLLACKEPPSCSRKSCKSEINLKYNIRLDAM